MQPVFKSLSGEAYFLYFLGNSMIFNFCTSEMLIYRKKQICWNAEKFLTEFKLN